MQNYKKLHVWNKSHALTLNDIVKLNYSLKKNCSA